MILLEKHGVSLNDKLKIDKTELAAVLTESAIKDLKKGIGINDRYVFVNELFRGDEAMYERSIKTINSFHILAEAEYWIERELKVKVGWDDGKSALHNISINWLRDGFPEYKSSIFWVAPRLSIYTITLHALAGFLHSLFHVL